MEMCYDGALVMPNNCVVMNSNEMEYVGGGFSISRNVFKYTVSAAVIAGCIALGGVISVAGLKLVLASYSLKATLVAAIVKGIGILGINVGNSLATKFASGLAGCIAGDFVCNIFDKYIDSLDGVIDEKVKIW